MGTKLTLQQQIAHKEAQLAKLKNRQREKDRKHETRRLIYHGRLLEKLMDRGVIGDQVYQKTLDEMLVRNYDREFFGLPLNPDEPKREQQSHKSSASPIEHKPVTTPAIIALQPQATPKGKRLQEHSVSEADFFT
jgi:hypothetical protein